LLTGDQRSPNTFFFGLVRALFVNVLRG
jgi:hypothetical protein